MKKILVANRGEIAVRVLRTAQRLGYATVTVFSDADADAPHVALGDQAVRLGPADVGESYLNSERVLDAAAKSGADAIHPGYGFLSENADFARHVIEAGLTWIGPPPDAMEVMGNKAASKSALADSDVPLVPGYSGNDQSNSTFATAAEEIGYPVMIKASAGGGGRGMRLVTSADALESNLDSARSESLKAFGSDELLLEKAIVDPRHVEFQVFGDNHGNVIHLGERDCSIQRRHQKVVEEAPSPAVSQDLRDRMGAAAIAAAKAVGYTNAGTVEFLLSDDGNFYFIEMNTRLQVEHPVTELVTGFDLVEWQLQVAAGDPLPATQKDVQLCGHAIEVRLYAESPSNDFLPSTGPVLHWQPPDGDSIRVDHGLASGQEITPFYDAMIAKVIAHGPDRSVARRRLSRALTRTVTLGVETNRGFLLDTIEHPTFAAGDATTGFLAQTWNDPPAPSPLLPALAAVVLTTHQSAPDASGLSAFRFPTAVQFDSRDPLSRIDVTPRSGSIHVQSATQDITVDVISCGNNKLVFECDGLRSRAAFAIGPDNMVWIQYGRDCESFRNALLAPAGSADTAASGRILAPMPGAVLKVSATAGDTVQAGQPLLVLEAMKMEHTIETPSAGTIAEVLVSAGDQVTPRQLMVVVEPTAPAAT